MSDFDGPEDSADKPKGEPTPGRGQDGPPSGAWDSDEALQFLTMEKSVHEDSGNEALTKRLLTEAAPMAAVSIINLSRSSGNDNTRLAASKYIVDRLLDGDGGEDDPLASLIGDVVKKAEEFANGGKQ